jgi:hypothetical protein
MTDGASLLNQKQLQKLKGIQPKRYWPQSELETNGMAILCIRTKRKRFFCKMLPRNRTRQLMKTIAKKHRRKVI